MKELLRSRYNVLALLLKLRILNLELNLTWDDADPVAFLLCPVTCIGAFPAGTNIPA
jgi:hypothetical protein